MSNLTSDSMGNTTFDPFQQSFTLMDGYGQAFPVSLAELDAFYLYGLQNCIVAGTQIGAAFILLVVLLLLTKPDKRTSPIFIVNTLALIFDIIRCVFSCLYFTGPFEETYAYFSEDYSQVHTQDYTMSVLKVVFSLLMLVCVEISLCLQTQVVCVTLRRAYRHAIFALSILIALAAIGVRFAFMVENAILIVQTKQESSLDQLGSAANITITFSICWFCAVFVAKLGVALRQRQRLGMGQFGPMQVIFIMGCQTLIVPVIFSILQYFVLSAMNSYTLTAVALFLPLSSLWASASLDSRFRQSKQSIFSPQMIGSQGSRSTAPMVDRNNFAGPVSPANTSGTRISSGMPSPGRLDEHGLFRDLEAQGLAGTGEFARRELE